MSKRREIVDILDNCACVTWRRAFHVLVLLYTLM